MVVLGIPHPFILAVDSLSDWPSCIVHVNHPVISADLTSITSQPEKILLVKVKETTTFTV